MIIYRGDRATLVKSPKYPEGRLSVVPFKIGRLRMRVPFSFSTDRAVAEKFALAVVKPDNFSVPVIIVANASKVRKTINWAWEREVVPIGTFTVERIEILE